MWALGAFGLRLGAQYLYAKIKGKKFDALEKPTSTLGLSFYTGNPEHDPVADEEASTVHDGSPYIADHKGKFF